MKEKGFGVGDFVFAKVRGFPHWPARIVSVSDSKPNNVRFNVYFFGTSERASVLAKDIVPFLGNESKFGTNVRRKFFKEAFLECKLEIAKKHRGEQSTRGLPGDDKFREFIVTDDETENTESPDSNKEAGEKGAAKKNLIKDKKPKDSEKTKQTEISESLEISEKKVPKENVRKSTKTTEKLDELPCQSDEKDYAVEQIAVKEEDKPTVDDEKIDNMEEKDIKQKEQISRSGRVIKPKRFLYDTGKELTEAPKAKKPNIEPERNVEVKKKRESVNKGKKSEKTKGRKSNRVKCVKYKKTENFLVVHEPEKTKFKIPSRNMEMGRLAWARAKNGQVVQIKLDFDWPVSFSDDRSRRAWEKKYEKRIKMELENIESGGSLSEDLAAQILPSDEERKQMSKEQFDNIKRLSLFERKQGKLRYLTLENRLLEIDSLFKAYLRKDEADPDKAVELLDEIISLPVDPLMLKKYPILVDTAKKLRSYTGNVKEWKMNSEDLDNFLTKAKTIRQKAHVLLNKYQSLFVTTKPGEFWGVFADSVSDFNARVKDLPLEVINSLSIDPASPLFKEVLQLEEEDDKFMLNLSQTLDNSVTM